MQRYSFGDAPNVPEVVVLVVGATLDDAARRELEAIGARAIDIEGRCPVLTARHVMHALFSGALDEPPEPPTSEELELERAVFGREPRSREATGSDSG